MPVTPTRLYDSRKTSAPVGKTGVVTIEPSQQDQTQTQTQTLPTAAAAYVYDVTVTAPTSSGFITAYASSHDAYLRPLPPLMVELGPSVYSSRRSPAVNGTVYAPSVDTGRRTGREGWRGLRRSAAPPRRRE